VGGDIQFVHPPLYPLPSREGSFIKKQGDGMAKRVNNAQPQLLTIEDLRVEVEGKRFS